MLESTLSGTWKKEDELKELKTELQALDRKIQLSLKPIEQGESLQEQDKSLGQPHSIEPAQSTSSVSGESLQTNGQSESTWQSIAPSAQPSTEAGPPFHSNNIHIVTIKPTEDAKPAVKGVKL